MSNKERSSNDDGSGCLFVIGAIIVAIALGNIYSAVHGWLALGGSLMFIAVVSAASGRK